MVIRFGVFDVDLQSGELRKGGRRRARLQDQPLKVLAKLAETPGELVTREALKECLWPPDVHLDREHGLAKAIVKLRAALGDSASSPRFIETVPRRGYRLLGEVEIVDGAEDGTRRAEPPPATPSRRRALLASTGALVVLAVLAVAMRHDGGLGRNDVPESLAVLPFRSLDAGPESLTLSLGTADTLITELGRRGVVTVRPLSSVMDYLDGETDGRGYGRRLDVDAVLEGTFQRNGDRFRVNLRLVRVADGSTLWAKTVDESAASPFDVQDAVAEEVVLALAPEAGRPRPGDVRRSTESFEAYEQYLRGKYLFERRTRASLEEAVASFERAIELDPDFALAHAGLAIAYGPLLAFGHLEPEVGNPQVKAAAYRALALDDSFAEVHTAVALAHSIDWEFTEEERSYQRAIDLDPNYALAFQWYGFLLRALGRHEEGLRMRVRAWEIDPTVLANSLGLASSLFRVGRVEEAIARIESTIALDPDYVRALETAGDFYAELGEHEKAQPYFQKAGERVSFACSLAQSGALAEARSAIEQLAGKRDSTPYRLAALQASLGERDAAFEFLERAFRERTAELTFLGFDWRMSPLRGDPRYERLLVRIGLRDAPSPRSGATEGPL